MEQPPVNTTKTIEALENSLSKSQRSTSRKNLMEMKYAHGMNLTRITEFEKDLHASIINSQESKSPDK